MKKTIFATLILLMSTNAFAVEKLNCMVSKFPAGSFFNFTDDKLITFKGDVESGQILVVDAKGAATVKSELQKDELSKNNIFAVAEMLNLVIVNNYKTGISAMGNKGAVLVDSQKGLAITCGVKDQAQ